MELRTRPGMRVVEALRVLAAARGPEDIVVTNQGSARVWPQISQHPFDFAYNPSTMGGAVPFGLGLALAQPRRRVIVVTGDGALLMSLGSLVSVAGAEAANLTVVVLDNGLYEVTGGQETPGPAAGVEFGPLALACGFRSSAYRSDLGDWTRDAAGLLAAEGPRMIHLVVGSMPQEFWSGKGPAMDEQVRGMRAELLKR